MPDDPQLLADLTAPTFEVTARGIQVESKDEVKARLGRSPDRADALIMAWSEGQSVLREAITRRPSPDPGKPRPKSYLDKNGGPVTPRTPRGSGIAIGCESGDVSGGSE
jgi:hypothetical protein